MPFYRKDFFLIIKAKGNYTQKFSSPTNSLSYFHSTSAQSSRILIPSQTTKVPRQSGTKQVNMCK